MRRFKISIYLFLILSLCSVSLLAVTKKKSVQTKTKQGVYIAENKMTARQLSNLPVPASYENYAFLQSIGRVTNIVIARFTEGDQTATWIQDKDADDIVDSITIYNFETKKFTYDSEPEKTYPADKFKSLKQDIINGKQNGITPNREGALAIKPLIAKNSDAIAVKKTKNGYSIEIADVDDRSRIRVSYLYSNNGINGVDLIFNVAYHNVRETLVQPVIKKSVYCKDSYDSVVLDAAKDLLSHTAKYYPYD